MKKWLCYDCIYAHKEIVKISTSNYLKPVFMYGKWLQPIIGGTGLIFDCYKQNKYIRKYITECKLYQNTNLFYVPPHPEFLPQKPFSNICTNCEGTGYIIEKHYLSAEDRFQRKKCDFCWGKGIIKRELKN